MGISEAAFTQLLKGQISSILSSLSAFSNHSHSFVLFILMVLLMTGIILCLQLPQRSRGLAMSNWGPERAVALSPIHPPPLISPQCKSGHGDNFLSGFHSCSFPYSPPLPLLGEGLFVAITGPQEVLLKQIPTESREATLGTADPISLHLILPSLFQFAWLTAFQHLQLMKLSFVWKQHSLSLLCVAECNQLHTYTI